MILKLTIASQEIEDFALEIQIDANDTFLNLHKKILDACDYIEGDRHRFYICDEDWRPEQRVFLNDEGVVRADEDLYLMEDTVLGDFLEDEGQRLAYRFDPESKRLFLIELTETSFGGRQAKPEVKRRHGQPPLQTIIEEEPAPAPKAATKGNAAADEEIEENFYGDESFEADEFDAEGFDITEG